LSGCGIAVAQYKILTTSRVPVTLTQQGKRFTVEGRTKILFEDFAISIPTLLFIRSGKHTEVSFRFVAEEQP
jgi:hypothetical protein